MKRVIFFVLLLVFSHEIPAQNLITNFGLEAWSKTDKPTGWNNTQGCLKDSLYVISGDYSCRQEGISLSRDLGQRIPVQPGKQYRFSFYYLTGSTTTGNGCRIWCEWLDNTQTGIDDPVSLPSLHSGYLKSDSWQEFSTSVTSPENAGYFYLIVRTLPNSVTYWDDFLLEEDIVSLNIETRYPEITVYPSPVHNYLTISNLHRLQQIDIQGLTGITYWSSYYSGDSRITIPVSGFPDGIYIIRIFSAGRIITKKFIKN